MFYWPFLSNGFVLIDDSLTLFIMNETLQLNSEPLFSVGAVEEELERIFHDPHFTESAILKRFLSFIVQETSSILLFPNRSANFS